MIAIRGPSPAPHRSTNRRISAAFRDRIRDHGQRVDERVSGSPAPHRRVAERDPDRERQAGRVAHVRPRRRGASRNWGAPHVRRPRQRRPRTGAPTGRGPSRARGANSHKRERGGDRARAGSGFNPDHGAATRSAGGARGTPAWPGWPPGRAGARGRPRAPPAPAPAGPTARGRGPTGSSASSTACVTNRTVLRVRSQICSSSSCEADARLRVDGRENGLRVQRERAINGVRRPSSGGPQPSIGSRQISMCNSAPFTRDRERVVPGLQDHEGNQDLSAAARVSLGPTRSHESAASHQTPVEASAGTVKTTFGGGQGWALKGRSR